MDKLKIIIDTSDNKLNRHVLDTVREMKWMRELDTPEDDLQLRAALQLLAAAR